MPRLPKTSISGTVYVAIEERDVLNAAHVAELSVEGVGAIGDGILVYATEIRNIKIN